jgi:predicted nucleotidyltransferase
VAAIETLLPSGTVRLVTHFLLDPDTCLHVRALHKRTGLGMGALQRELTRLESLGLVRRTEEARRVYYAMQHDHPSWKALWTLVREHANPADVLRVALRDVEGIQGAFVFGSFARGNARPDSDVDLLIIEEAIPSGALSRATLSVESLLAKPLDIKRYTADALASKFRAGRAFVRDVIEGPKAWVIGSDTLLPTR